MNASPQSLVKGNYERGKLVETLRRAFVEFLTVPSLVIAGFMLLAVVTNALDHTEITWLAPLRSLLRERVFRDGKATSDLLGVIATSLITVTSITFSLLLLAVQQSAAALSAQVYDQFLRRRVNQIYFGFFVGLALYCLVILATVDAPYNPIFGAGLAFLLTIMALYFIILLLYTTVDQMRPAVVIEAIHDHILLAWQRHQRLLARTRRSAAEGGLTKCAPQRVNATKQGFVVCVEIEKLHSEISKTTATGFEIVLLVEVGTFVAFQDPLAEIRGCQQATSETISKVVESAIHLEGQRDLDNDPAYGIEQLVMIGWTSVSTAKSNPAPGILVIYSLRDILARWAVGTGEKLNGGTEQARLPVVYVDNVFGRVLDALETLAVVASESMQAQTTAEIVQTFALMFDRLPPNQQPRAEDVIRRSLSALGEHVLTAELNEALLRLGQTLNGAGRYKTASQVEEARNTLAASIGRLGSRGTRGRKPSEPNGGPLPKNLG